LPPSPHRLKEEVRAFSRSNGLLSSDGLVLAAVSGGPDSMALLSILYTLSAEMGYRLVVAHFDHGIRESSRTEGALVERYAKDLSLPVHTGTGDVPAEAERSGDSLEVAARRARYRFLEDVADEAGAEHIATGHTRDDQIETVLMRIIRGTGVRGLAGIPTRRGRIVRPLLCLGRDDTRAYCDGLGVPYALDPTNEDRHFLRNRIRHDLLPVLESSYDEGVRGHLLGLAESAQRVLTAARASTDPLIARNLRKIAVDAWTLDVTDIAALDDASMVVLLGDVLSESLGGDLDLSRVHYEQLVALVRDSRGSGKSLHLPGITIKREYENLVITRASGREKLAARDRRRTTLALPGETRVGDVVVRTEIVGRSQLGAAPVKATAQSACFAVECLRPPLVLRSARAGDRMQPFGMSGTKKLSDMFIDKKIPGRERSGALVVADTEEIIWVVGLTTNERSRVTRDTGEVVRITLERE
jgi:tRNA(Ile)-lysidine synthase